MVLAESRCIQRSCFHNTTSWSHRFWQSATNYIYPNVVRSWSGRHWVSAGAMLPCRDIPLTCPVARTFHDRWSSGWLCLVRIWIGSLAPFGDAGRCRCNCWWTSLAVGQSRDWGHVGGQVEGMEVQWTPGDFAGDQGEVGRSQVRHRNLKQGAADYNGISVCVCACECACACVCMSACLSACIHKCTYVCMSLYVPLGVLMFS